MARVVWSLGANEGDRLANLAAAVDALGALPGHTVVGVSQVYASAPWGGVATNEFLNLVVLGESDWSPEKLLGAAHGIEAALGRVRTQRWGDRMIDVDVVAVEGVERSTSELSLPHPRASERAFVLVPWAELAPDMVLGGALVKERAAAHPDAPGLRRLGSLEGCR